MTSYRRGNKYKWRQWNSRAYHFICWILDISKTEFYETMHNKYDNQYELSLWHVKTLDNSEDIVREIRIWTFQDRHSAIKQGKHVRNNLDIYLMEDRL